ncbi:unnamed protein product [Zymoseptoria tritici ST99CH_1E4]|uniref:T6SS Phospholipase effector Tle1-like catalytic domain-containing protein n=1 Tax=Zymoseptoria tritici ST99CH_1E4 TaxID=1276532 RepID=A0A2H1GJ23_ZYMTR|nr:unnamed protein product [Zymoseptoria tritici ST99CH_1E4]
MAGPATASTASPAASDTMPERLPKHIRAVNDSKTYKVHERTLIICLDGTGDKFDADNSNIVHLVGCLKKDDPTQVTYYQTGIGTYDGGGLSNGFNASLDMAVGSGLGVHIRDAYKFLMQAYNEGDKICLFGFSRGAYTARCLAGMIHKVGLLPAHNVAQVEFAYQFYKDDSAEGWKMSRDFKRTFCIEVNVHFIGVFDSVASVGFIPRKLPLSATPTNKPLYFRHAIGLDERRAKFKVSRYQFRESVESQEPGGEDKWKVAALHEQSVKQPIKQSGANTGAEFNGTPANGSAHPGKRHQPGTAQTDSLEVWFAGCHADVGGGAVKNEVRHKLSQIPLRWMIRQCFECDTGIIFNTHRLAEEGLDVHTLWPRYIALGRPTAPPPKHLMEKYRAGEIGPISRRTTALEDVGEDDNDNRDEGSFQLRIWEDDEKQVLTNLYTPEQTEDFFDAISPLNDQLKDAKGWWALELWPIKVRVQPEGSEQWVKKVRMNLGRYRPAQELAPNLHWTVQQRMEEKGYQVKTRTSKNAKWRIVV